VRSVQQAMGLKPEATWQLSTAASTPADAAAASYGAAASLLQSIGDLATANADVTVHVLDASSLQVNACLLACLVACYAPAAMAQ
jgi:hypothetical protein